MKLRRDYAKKGQSLVILLIFMVITSTIVAASVVLILNASQGADRFEEGVTALHIANSGGEEALMRLLRDPNYPGTTTPVPVGQGSFTIAITSTPTNKTIISSGTYNNFQRKIQINAGYSNGILTITPPWQEIN